MIQLLTDRPFHSIRLKASNNKDRFCALFYKTLAHVKPSFFDPNYGILFFNDDKKLNAFIASTVIRQFGEEESSINLYLCKKREPSSC